MRSKLETLFAFQLKALKVAAGKREFRFAPPRRWRFDFCWPSRMLAVEIEGGTMTGGRHTRGVGFQADCEKYRAAALAGWTVLRYTSQDVKNGTAIQEVAQVLA